MTSSRARPSATLLADGRVLAAGGVNEGNVVLATAEIYEPATGVWTTTGSLNEPRGNFTATRLADGRVLAASGITQIDQTVTAEIYNPATGTWTYTGSLSVKRANFTANLLRNGSVLVAGGMTGSPDFRPTMSCELYNPATGLWTATGNLSQRRFVHSAVSLPSGQVVVISGATDLSYSLTSETYNPKPGAWTISGNLPMGRGLFPAVLLPNRQILVAGGEGPVHQHSSITREAELATPVRP